jgi:hypothetical protein
MKSMIHFAMAAAVAVVIAGPFSVAQGAAVHADEVFNGTLLCAKCALKKADAHECQDVLIVTDAKGAKTEYYITKNEVAEKSGEACTLEIKATVTGTVAEKDGKVWLTPSKIEKQ